MGADGDAQEIGHVKGERRREGHQTAQLNSELSLVHRHGGVGLGPQRRGRPRLLVVDGERHREGGGHRPARSGEPSLIRDRLGNLCAASSRQQKNQHEAADEMSQPAS
jgi:hypothetical protein